jgi:hypothetical protein
MQKGGKYRIDKSMVLQKAYLLLCLFFANKEIARVSNPNNSNDSLKSLEELFFSPEVSRLLIEIAIAVRVIDDQIPKLSPTDKTRINYEASKQIVDKLEYALFDDLDLTLREVCNKIIHSDIMEPHYADGTEPHELDLPYKHGYGDKEIHWQQLNGFVRLSGSKGKEVWYVLLNIQVFIRGVYKLLTIWPT